MIKTCSTKVSAYIHALHKNLPAHNGLLAPTFCVCVCMCVCACMCVYRHLLTFMKPNMFYPKTCCTKVSTYILCVCVHACVRMRVCVHVCVQTPAHLHEAQHVLPQNLLH